MDFGGVKLLLSFALFGFIAGSVAFLAFDYFALNILTTVPILAIVLSPWFISGIIGAVLAVAIVLIYAHFSGD
jgi:flagellin-like protein